jgi:hypothetical protein
MHVWYVLMKVAGKTYALYRVPLGVECTHDNPLSCQEPGPSQEEAFANYVARTIEKLASGSLMIKQ